MKPEKEFYWLIILIRSEFTKGWFKERAGCKKDFERVLGAPENSKEFNDWFDELIEVGCLEFVGLIPSLSNSTRKVKGYTVNKSLCEKRLKTLPCHDVITRYYDSKRLIDF